jgi:hypothetical protein
VPSDTVMPYGLKYIMIVVYNWQCSKFWPHSLSLQLAAPLLPPSGQRRQQFPFIALFSIFFGCYCCCCVLCTPPVDFNGGFLFSIFSDFNDPSVNV